MYLPVSDIIPSLSTNAKTIALTRMIVTRCRGQGSKYIVHVIRPTSNILPEFLPIFGYSSVLEVIVLIERISLDKASYHLFPLFFLLLSSFFPFQVFFCMSFFRSATLNDTIP